MKVTGVVTPPEDQPGQPSGTAMLDAARKSLSTEGFNNLMRLTAGEAPTPQELCAAVDQERANDHRATRNPS